MAAWDRQPKEPQTAFDHFVQYRDMGPERSLSKLAGFLHVSVQTLAEKSTLWNWVARCAAYDAHIDKHSQAAFLRETEKQAKTRAQAFGALLGKSLEALKNLDTDKARLGEIASAMKVAIEGMRLEAGLATDKIQHEVTLTDDERLRALEALAAAAENRAGLGALHAGRARESGQPAGGGAAVN